MSGTGDCMRDLLMFLPCKTRQACSLCVTGNLVSDAVSCAQLRQFVGVEVTQAAGRTNPVRAE